MVEEKKVYKSFQEIPPRDYMYFPKGVIEADKPGRFSKTEIVHLLISIAVLTLAFSFVLPKNNIFYRGINLDINSLISFLPISFLAVLTAFFFHEISHKFMAQRYGLWSEFRMYPFGLLLALILAFFTPLIFAAPGAVMFRGDSRNFENGKIATAGPLANLIVAFITLPLYFIFFESTLGQILGLICLINAFLATFNLLPLGTLDGAKIVRWNATIWIILLSIAIAIMAYVMINISFAL